MDRVSITVPKLGEGIREVRVVSVLVEPQQSIERDEPFAEVETDKASLVIESPVAGTVREILCQAGDLVPVGANLAWVDGGGSRADRSTISVNGTGPADGALGALLPLGKMRVRNGDISPRQKALTRGTSEAFPQPTSWSSGANDIRSIGQRALARQLRESHLSTVPASIEMELDWSAVEEVRRRVDTVIPPSGLELVAWATARAMEDHPRFQVKHRVGREPELATQVELGIAVALPDDLLATVRITGDRSFLAFMPRMRAALAAASPENSSGNVSLVISDLSTFGVTSAVPVVVSPSIATLFIGCPDWRPQRAADKGVEWRRMSRLVLAFDHCLINGAGASSFLRAIIDRTTELPT